MVAIGRNDRFQATSVGVQGGPTAVIGVDADGVISSAGALQIERNAATFIQGTTVGGTTDTYTRNQFGEPTAYTARHGTTELFSEQYVRDRGGRIRMKTVRIRNPATGDLETYTAAYGYDTPGRLQTVTYNGTDPVHYGYDANNNLIGAPPVTSAPEPGPVRLYLQEATPAATPRPPPAGRRYARPTHYPWADLLRRTFAIDALACPGCGGRLRLLATIADPGVIAKILRHLGLPVEGPVPAPARQAAWWPP